MRKKGLKKKEGRRKNVVGWCKEEGLKKSTEERRGRER
jgi:hypothetical protein